MDNLILLIWLAVFGVVIYFFTIRPQQQQARKHNELMSSLTEGDEVITAAGLYGFVADIDDDFVWLEVNQGVELKISKASIASRVGETDESDED
jgi:preprotein translocase subunit YajC